VEAWVSEGQGVQGREVWEGLENFDQEFWGEGDEWWCTCGHFVFCVFLLLSFFFFLSFFSVGTWSCYYKEK